MPYIGNQHNVGDHVNNFKVLDDISSYTATFDGSASSVVIVADETIRIPEHRFIQGQRVVYNNGGGSNIGGLSSGTAYYVSFDSANTIKLATSLANANSNTVINLSITGGGTSHTLTASFDGVNTKFKLTHGNGKAARLNNATQLNVAINNVIQRPNVSALTFTEGFALEDNHKIVFKTAPTVDDIFWGSIIANTIENFDLKENEVNNFTGDGSTTEFTLSSIPANNESVVVTVDGVLQHPSDSTTARAYTLIDSVLQFTAAPALNAEIQVRHIGFAGASTNDVSGFYGRTGNVSLTANDHITTGDITARNFNATGITTFGTANFSGSVSIGGTLTYEDVINVDSVGVGTFREGIFLPDNKMAKFGNTAADPDLEIYHGGTASYISHTGTGNLYIHSNTVALRKQNQQAYFIGVNGQSKLCESGNEKLATTSSGVSITGNANVTGQLFSSYATLSAVNPTLTFSDTDNNPDYTINLNSGILKITDSTNTADRIVVNSTGVSIPNDLDVDGHTNLDNVSVAGVSTFSNSVKFAGTTSGRDLNWYYGSNKLNLADNVLLGLGNSDDLLIHHTGSTGYIKGQNGNLYIQSDQVVVIGNQSASSTGLKFTNGGAAELFFNNAKKIETYSGGVQITGNVYIPDGSNSSGYVGLGNAADLRIYHDGSLNVIDATAHNLEIRHGSEKMIVAVPDGAVELYYDNLKKFETRSNGINVTGRIFCDGTAANNRGLIFNDNVKISLGSSNDLEIFHDGYHSRIKDAGTGDLVLISNTISLVNAADSEILAQFKENGSVDLYYDNTKRFETTSQGINVIGHSELDNVNIAGVTTMGQTTIAHTSAPQLIIKDSDTTGAADSNGISFQDASNTQYGFIGQTSSGGHTMLITTTNTVNPIRLQVNSSTKLEVGHTGTYVQNGNFYVLGGYSSNISGDVNLNSNAPTVNFNDSNANPDYKVFVNTGVFKITDTTNNVDRITIASNGNISITNDLDVDGHTNLDNVSIAGVTTSTGNIYADNYFANSGLTLNNNANVAINLTSVSTTGSSRIFFGDPDSALVGRLTYTHNGDYMSFYTAYNERLRIDSQGNVKSGTVGSALNFTDSNSGNTKFIEVGATSGGDALFVTHSSGYGVGYFGYEAGGDRLVIACDGGGGNNKIDFITDAGTSVGGGTDNLNAKVPKMRITAAGNVGINVTSPSQALHVAGSIINSTNVNSTGDQGIQMGNGHRLGFDQSGTRSWTMKANAGNLTLNSGDGNGAFDFNTTAHLKLPTGTSAQRVNTTGALRYNSDIGNLEFYNGSTWKRIRLLEDAPTSGLLAYWPFSTASRSGSTYNDVSGNGQHLTVYGTITDNTTETKFNGCIDFGTADGNHYLKSSSNSFTDIDASSGYSGVSISVWVKTTVTNNYQQWIISEGTVNTRWNYFVENATGPKWRSVNSGDIIMSGSMMTGNWHHLVVTYQSSNNLVKHYRDGSFTNSGTTGITPSFTGGYLLVGQHSVLAGNSATYRWRGMMAHMRLYNRVLTESEITVLSQQW